MQLRIQNKIDENMNGQVVWANNLNYDLNHFGFRFKINSDFNKTLFVSHSPFKMIAGMHVFYIFSVMFMHFIFIYDSSQYELRFCFLFLFCISTKFLAGL